ncbi:E3 ubiquitin/ISG15 ligase TRIM25 [Sinocyclocheilus grahami]|uniref:E3 ubiquitin/ISG15 ligase TRIM25 n=1 Tax=Sinocyclocheilus grahami TaxID=75366 RepID=UPI0007ACD164|nr:PREDICTED: E3 ubiquitin/ISG15 ligase TRIM25-like [Sinocyclocheilus grahami]
MSLLYEDIVKFVANNLKCSICMEIFTKPVTLVCGHNYCQKCINACWAKSSARRDCPHCRADVSSSKLEMNFTLCDILELQDLGGRETWEQILAETDQADQTQHARTTLTKVDILMKRLDWLKDEIKKMEDTLSAELSSNQACAVGICDSSIVQMDVSSSSLDSDASSCYAGRSFSLTSGDLPSQSEEESSQEFVEEAPENSESLFEDAHLTPSAGAQQRNRDSAEAGLHAEFVELSFSPQLGNKRLVFHTESHRVETQPGNQARTLHGRFDACQWMAEQEFRGEWVYWDVDTTFSTGWAVGVANPSLKRSERLGRTPSSWCLEWSSGQLSAWHNNIKTSVKHSIPNGIRVILDMPKGQLSFQSLRDSLLELHSFQVDSSGPFIPIFWLYGLSHNALTFPRH